jgi:hypothetical protein
MSKTLGKLLTSRMLVTLRFAEELLAPEDLDLSGATLKAGNFRCRPPSKP